jgi:hypothetical protein
MILILEIFPLYSTPPTEAEFSVGKTYSLICKKARKSLTFLLKKYK